MHFSEVKKYYICVYLNLFLQICSGIDENAVGMCAELVFAPIDEMFPDDAPLLPSGFRVIPLISKTVSLYNFNHSMSTQKI